MPMNGQGTKWRINIAENFNRLSKAHESYRRQTDGLAIAYSERELANVNSRSRSLKNGEVCYFCEWFLRRSVVKLLYLIIY